MCKILVVSRHFIPRHGLIHGISILWLCALYLHLSFPDAQHLIHALLAFDHRLDDRQSSREIGEQDMSNP